MSESKRPRSVSRVRIPIDARLLPLSLDPTIFIPPEILQRHNARILDPTTTPMVDGQPPFRPTVYIADRLMVSGAAEFAARTSLDQAADLLGLELQPHAAEVTRRDALIAVAAKTRVANDPSFARDPEANLAAAAVSFPTFHRIVPKASSSAAPDAWEVIQKYRDQVGANNEPAQQFR